MWGNTVSHHHVCVLYGFVKWYGFKSAQTMVFEVHKLYLVVHPNLYSKVAWNAGDKRTLIRHGTPKDSGLVGWGSTFGSPRPHHGPVFPGEREGSAGALAWYRAKGWSILYKIKDMWSSRQNFRVSSSFSTWWNLGLQRAPRSLRILSLLVFLLPFFSQSRATGHKSEGVWL